MSFWPSSNQKLLVPLKYACRLNPEVLSENTDPDFEMEYIDIGNVTLENGVRERQALRFGDAPSRARKSVREGDTLISTVRTYLKAIAHIETGRKNWVASTGFAVLRPNRGVHPRFLYRIAQAGPFVDAVVACSTGVSYPAINPSTLGSLEIPLPDFATQKAIADFLDHETVRIDQLIEKREAFLALIAEKKDALVAKAINGAILEQPAHGAQGWFGRLPQGWSIRRAKFLFRERQDRSESGAEELLTVSHITGVTRRSEKDVNMFLAESMEGYKLVSRGDVVVNTMWAWMGAMGVSPVDGLISPSYGVYSPITDDFDPGEFKKSYEAAVQRSSAHSEKMKQLQDIEDQLGKHVRETARVREELRNLAAAEAVYRSERDAWEALLKERDDLLDAQCKTLTESSGGSIRAHVKRYADGTDFVNNLRQCLSGSRVQGGKIEKLGETITGAEEVAGAQWNAVLLDLEKLAEIDAEREGSDRKPETPALVGAGFSSGDLDRVVRSLKSEDWLTLSLTPIKSLPVFEYRARENDYIPFRNASAGQQATALLKTLLNQGGPPLIIDQPEEDLDNPVMLEIVAQVWQAKQKRQLIFASHNANLVVNGDAELVAWCDYRTAGDQSRGTIAGEGAIDIPTVRDAIKAIMEGGEAAFNLRKEKYGF